MKNKNRIIFDGPKDDGTYVVEFTTSEGETLAISIPRSEVHVIRHFQERVPYGITIAKKKTPEEIAEENERTNNEGYSTSQILSSSRPNISWTIRRPSVCDLSTP